MDNLALGLSEVLLDIREELLFDWKLTRQEIFVNTVVVLRRIQELGEEVRQVRALIATADRNFPNMDK